MITVLGGKMINFLLGFFIGIEVTSFVLLIVLTKLIKEIKEDNT